MSKALELADDLEKRAFGYPTGHATGDNLFEITQHIRLLAAEVEALRSAAVDVLTHVNGELPVRGWLNDNDKSRAALGRLKQVIKENPHG